MSKREIAIFSIGMLCGSVIFVGALLTIRPLLRVEVVAENADSQRPQGVSAPSDITGLTYALDGYCPVSLVEKWQWTLGNAQFSATRGTQVFLFAGPIEQEQFQKNPNRYIPVFSGNDVVLAKENEEKARGKRQHGITYKDRIYLFASEESLERFSQDPGLYVVTGENEPVDGNIKVAANSDGSGDARAKPTKREN